MIKNKSGITLVALVITIIILLILAGISIQAITNTGLFEKAKEAKQITENAENEEKAILADYNNKINEIVGGSTRENETTSSNTQNTMSGEEHFIGEYYFNGKPIYEKTIYISSLPNKADKTYNHGISDADELWFNTSKSFVRWEIVDTKDVSPFAYVRTSTLGIAISLFGLSKDVFHIETGADRTGVCAYVTINYTKTTDAGNGTVIQPTPAN